MGGGGGVCLRVDKTTGVRAGEVRARLQEISWFDSVNVRQGNHNSTFVMFSICVSSLCVRPVLPV